MQTTNPTDPISSIPGAIDDKREALASGIDSAASTLRSRADSRHPIPFIPSSSPHPLCLGPFPFRVLSRLSRAIPAHRNYRSVFPLYP